VVACQRCDLLDPVLASGAPAPLSQEAALALGAQAGEARIGDVAGAGGITRFPTRADHPFASPEDADPLPRPPLPGRHLRRARQWPLRSPGGRNPARPSRNTSPSSADWPAYLITSARRFCPAGGAGRAATFADWPTFEGSNPK
jgi:hypothetical protein